MRRKVSLKKKRYQLDGFDLDLTYILPNVIATGFPSEGKEAIYRNPRWEMQRLLESKHKGHYKMWNLCSERHYDPDLFDNRVETRFFFDDHQAPPFEMVESFCKTVHDYLQADPQNVAVIHCKAGKGRTGVMTCAYLIYSRLYPDPEDAMDFYAKTRTWDLKGVNIPCQRRYVEYFGKAMYHAGMPPYPKQGIIIKSFRMVPPPFKGITPLFKIKDIQGNLLYNHKDHFSSRKFKGSDQEVVINECDKIPQLEGDIHIDIRSHGMKTTKVFKLWLNTYFLEGTTISLTKWELDTAWKDTKHKVFPKEFRFEITFERVPVKGRGFARVLDDPTSPWFPGNPNQLSKKAIETEDGVLVASISSGRSSDALSYTSESSAAMSPTIPQRTPIPATSSTEDVQSKPVSSDARSTSSEEPITRSPTVPQQQVSKTEKPSEEHNKPKLLPPTENHSPSGPRESSSADSTPTVQTQEETPKLQSSSSPNLEITVSSNRIDVQLDDKPGVEETANLEKTNQSNQGEEQPPQSPSFPPSDSSDDK